VDVRWWNHRGLSLIVQLFGMLILDLRYSFFLVRFNSTPLVRFVEQLPGTGEEKYRMPITLSEAVTCLKHGESLTWALSGPYKAGSIQLSMAGQRRLFNFLIENDLDAVTSADDSIFEGLVAAWGDETADPAGTEQVVASETASGPWRLSHISASGFGGLNTPDGPAFELDVGGENWCIEGYNGSGKTSLSSLILWTLTGYRNREQDGPVKDGGRREVVTDPAGNKIGTWPPLVTYPFDLAELNKVAQVTACLIFTDQAGDIATAKRTISSPANGEPTIDVEIDSRLIASPELIETGLLMPARISHIGFGDKSQSLYAALKMLTGLDQLSGVAAGAAALGHASKKFLKYARNQGAEALERDFANSVERARELATNTSIDLTKIYNLGDDKLIEKLSRLEIDASTKAGAALDILKTEISANIDVKDAKDRDRLNDAVSTARVYVGEGTKGVPLFKSWGALEKARDDNFSSIEDALNEADIALTKALEWHAKQESDKKLRLKALASKFFVTEDLLGKTASCPLCETKLTSEDQLALAGELAALKSEATNAERAIADACGDIQKMLMAHVPDYLQSYLKDLAAMDLVQAFSKAIKVRFSELPPYNDILTGIGEFVVTYVAEQAEKLPAFTHDAKIYDASDITSVQELQDLMINLDKVSALTAWWYSNSSRFILVWNNLIGIANADSEWSTDSLEGKLQTLENAIAGSDPLDKIAKHLVKAKKAAEDWQTINDIQKVREAIAEAVKPLKDLQKLVDSETHRTIVTLSDRVSAILNEIRLKDRFSFENTAMSKKTVTVEGSFAEGMKIDAALVANTSWLRALLWSFIFALREQAIADTGMNNFPLMVLDDPQTSFDPKNTRKWATKIVGAANLDESDTNGLQLFLTTHERQFYEFICETNELVGQEGMMAGPSSSSKVAHIVNGTFLNRQFDKASTDNNDEEGYIYVQQVRTYCEDLLKIMLRSESYEIGGDTLGKLCMLLKKLHDDHIDPFNRSVFLKLIRLLNEKTVPQVKIINASHHTYDRTIGFAEAEDIHKYWKEKLQTAFINAFRLAADFDAYGGVSRLFAWRENVSQFPGGHTDKIKSLTFVSTGVAAAAISDGRVVGDGQIDIQKWPDEIHNTLFNHSAYRLNAGTLDPIADIGDIILVQNFGETRHRDLVVVAFGDNLYARRFNESEDHSDVVILTGQSTNPYALAEPVIALKDKIESNKIVGTVFMSQLLPPSTNNDHEVSPVDDFVMIEARLKDAKLFKVKGRSMEPIALEDQFVITLDETLDQTTLRRLSGELVIAVDQNGGVYFKRLRLHGHVVVLESANSSVTTSSEILSLTDEGGYPKLTGLRSVVGVLFDLPATE